MIAKTLLPVLLMFFPAVLMPATGLAQDKSGDDVLYLTFDDVEFEMEKDEDFDRDMLTDDINEMEGKRISIRGFILPNGTRQSGNRSSSWFVTTRNVVLVRARHFTIVCWSNCGRTTKSISRFAR